MSPRSTRANASLGEMFRAAMANSHILDNRHMDLCSFADRAIPAINVTRAGSPTVVSDARADVECVKCGLTRAPREGLSIIYSRDKPFYSEKELRTACERRQPGSKEWIVFKQRRLRLPIPIETV